MENIIKSQAINSAEELREYLEVKARGHNYYKYYAPKPFIDEIINNHCLYLSTGTNWNDTIDKNEFNSEGSDHLNFALCLSYSRSESVAMWMLYSGNNGCMIDYDSKIIKEVLSTPVISLGYFDGPFIEERSVSSKDFSIRIIDIIYYGESKTEGCYYVKRSDETNQEFNSMIVDDLKLCKKTTAWSYENECRIIVSISSKYKTEKTSHVRVIIDEESINRIKKRVYDSPNTIELAYNPCKLAGKINWNLCRDCKDKCYKKDCLLRNNER